MKEHNLNTLKKFCMDRETRYGTTTMYPMSRGNFVYASDASILVRMPREMLPDTFEEGDGKQPNTEYVFNDDILSNADFSSVLMEASDDQVICPACFGAGKVRKPGAIDIECEGCGGTGTIECESCGHDHECEACDGYDVTYDTVACSCCNGSGNVFLTLIGNTKFSPRYIKMVEESFQDVRWGICPGDQKAVFMAADNVCGALMGYRDRD